MTALPVVGCGRIDDHDPHEWTRPRQLDRPAATYACTGHVVIEGGARS